MLSYAIEPKSRGDEDKINQSMHRLEEEDPTIRYARDPQTHELLLAGQGQLHIEVTVAKLKRRFGVEVNLKPPRIPYRETITAQAPRRTAGTRSRPAATASSATARSAWSRCRAAATSSSSTRSSAARSRASSSRPSRRASRNRGCAAISPAIPVVDFRVVLTDGQYHDVDSNELSFKTAGWLAFKDGMSKARPTLLEPIMNVEVYAPSDYAGDLMGDLNGRRGRIGGMEPRGQMTAIKAQVPMAEMLTYEQHLTSVTGGRGSYHMEFSHYDEVPSHQQQKIIAASKAERGQAVEASLSAHCVSGRLAIGRCGDLAICVTAGAPVTDRTAIVRSPTRHRISISAAVEERRAAHLDRAGDDRRRGAAAGALISGPVR